ncbi:MAG: FISUMP domain-containing protein [Bacteroidales bacterium]
MRSRILSLFLIFNTLSIHAQYYLVNFKGVGAATTIDSIRVLNLAQNTSVKLAETDTLLLAGVVGLPNPQGKASHVKIWPTPSEGDCQFSFYSPTRGNASFEIFDATGKIIFAQTYTMVEGENSYYLKGLPDGLNILNIITPKEKIVAKIPVVNRHTQGTPELKPTGQRPILKKSRAIVVMQYNDNEVLLFKAYSGNYARYQPYIINATQTLYFDFIQCTDIMGNIYPVVRIGTQVWMAGNLKNTYFNNGTPIPVVEDDNTWKNLTTPALSWYNNNAAQNAYMGAFYNFYAVEGNNICPSGWRIPTLQDFEQLLVFLQQYGYNYNGINDPDNNPYTNDYTAKALTSRSLWKSSDVTGAPGNTDYPNYRNRSGFEAFPYGLRNGYTGGFNNLTVTTYFWTQSVNTNGEAYKIQFFYNNPASMVGPIIKSTGMNVRCIKN